MKNKICLLLLIFGHSIFAQNKVEKSKKELNSSAAVNTSSQNQNKSSSDSGGGGDDEGIASEVVEVFFGIIVGVFKYGLIGDYTNEDHLHNKLSKYPFYTTESGNYNESVADSVKNKFRIDIEDKFLYSNNDLFGNHLNVKIRPFQYFFVQTDFHQLYEINRIDDTNNLISLYHFNLGYDRIRMGKFDLGWNAGASYVGNEVKKGGFSFGLSGNYFMTKNFSFSANAKWSEINHKPVNTLEFEAKFHKKNYFFTAGFEHLKIATPTYNFIGLGGGIYL